MLQIIWNALRSGSFHSQDGQLERWRCDPLAHPVLDHMTQTELGDLPLGSARYDCEADQPPHGHFTSGGRLERIELTLPPVLSPKIVPRS